jgi:hypothetical protein
VQTAPGDLGRPGILDSSAGAHVAGPLAGMTPAGTGRSLVAIHVRAVLVPGPTDTSVNPADGPTANVQRQITSLSRAWRFARAAPGLVCRMRQG